MTLFGTPIDPDISLAVVVATTLVLCGVHAWTEGRRFERLYGGRGENRGGRTGSRVVPFRRPS